MKEKYFNLPNCLTYLRFIFSPVFFFLFLQGENILGVVIFLCVALTDLIDGWVARVTNQQTKFGKFIDPMADKFMVFLAVLALVLKFGFPIWAVFLFLSRDVISLLGSLLVHIKKRGSWAASKFGKLTTALQIIAIIAYALNFYKEVILLVTLVFSVITAISYAFRWVYIAKGGKEDMLR